MTAPAQSNQTVSFLRRRFAEVGIEPHARHGQNFLVDLNLVRLIVERAELEPRDVVLEVGTGTGSLTGLVAPRVAAVVTVEIDPRLWQLAHEELFALTNVIMLQQDALRNKSHFDERVLRAVSEQMAAGPDRRFKLVANLPYNVATPVIANLLSAPIVPHSMTVTVQKELGDRIAARPGTKDYSALSVWIQSQCHVEVVRTLPPTVFWPRPKVTSAILHIRVDESLRGQIPDREFFHDFVRALFLHRRKFLRGVLQSRWKAALGKSGVDQALAETGLNPEARAEQLEIGQMLALCETIRRMTAVAGGDAQTKK